MRESTLRWVWAHDADGNRLTEAECVSTLPCGYPLRRHDG